MKKSDFKQDRAMVRAAVHKHEKAMHPGKKPTPMKRGGRTPSPYADYASKNPLAYGAK